MEFLAPAGLALAGLSVPLVALYFLRVRRHRVVVSSLLPWHALQKSERLASPFQRFRRHLLLLLQLLALLLVTLALARPAIEGRTSGARSVVLVVDTSASMGATDVRPHRLGAAVADARAALATLGPDDEAMLVEAGPRTQVRVPFTRDLAQVGLALDRLVATEAEGELRPAVQLATSLARSRPGLEVVVLSDGGPGDLQGVSTGSADVRYARVGTHGTNAGITALDLRRSPVNDLDRQLFVTVHQFGPKVADGTVEVYVEGALLAVRTEALPPGEPVSMVFDVPGAARGSLRVRLAMPGDALAADDQAWAVLAPPASRRVLLAGAEPMAARALAADPRVTLVRVPLEQVTPELLDSVDAALFAGAVPDAAAGRPYAVLGPFPGSPVTFGPTLDGPRILEWQRTHPVLRFVGLEGATVGRAHTVTDPGGLVPIVASDVGPLVLAGERSGARVVALAFDPYATDLPLRVAWPVFLLNTVGWLTEGTDAGGEARLLRTGQAWTRTLSDATVDTARVDGPAGGRDLTVSDGVIRVTDTDRAGVYTVRSGPVTTSFAANLLSERESRIAPRPTLDLDQGTIAVAEASVAPGRRELWRPLAAAALAMICLEWFAWNRRKVA